MATYDIGDGQRISGEFRDISDQLVDPDVVQFQFKTPAGAITTYVYGTDDELVKDSAGHYHVDVKFASAGLHYYRWLVEGPDGATEGAFKVIDSEFV
jgi:hypothetical protein